MSTYYVNTASTAGEVYDGGHNSLAGADGSVSTFGARSINRFDSRYYNIYMCAGLSARDPGISAPLVSTIYVCAGLRSDIIEETSNTGAIARSRYNRRHHGRFF